MKHEGFTPGPWRERLVTGKYERRVYSGREGTSECRIIAIITDASLNHARLIADAPNLLAQRDRLVEALERHLRYFEEADQQREGWKLMCLQTRALLDEIKG